MSDVFVARQPIFNLDDQLVGYELLYRDSRTATGAGGATPVGMSSATLVAALLTIGLDRLVDGSRAFVNFPRDLLLSDVHELLDPRQVTVEVLETVTCDPETVAAVRALNARGFDVALDDFCGGAEYDPLLELAQVVKVDVLGATRETLAPVARRLARHPARLLAERVEDPETYGLCRSLGFSMFQGYYFQRPQTVAGRDLPAGLGAIARLMNLVSDSRTTDRELECAFRTDPGLSLKLLRIVNSAAVGGVGIDSIQRAVQIVGRSTLHRWLSLLLASALPRGTGVQRELAFEALELARMCELLAMHSGRPQAAASAFLAGLLSKFDAILGITMRDLLRHVHVSSDVASALLHANGPLTPYLDIASSYVRGSWEPMIAMADGLGVGDRLGGWYTDAGTWAREVLTAA